MKAQPNPQTDNDPREITDGLLACISHDLRTPLSAIMLWTKVLSEREELSVMELRDGLQAIRDCAGEQQALIEEIVDLARLATGRVKLRQERTELAGELATTFASLGTEAAAAGVALSFFVDPSVGTVLTDARRIRQLVTALVSHSFECGQVGVTVSVFVQRRADLIEIAVKNPGGSQPEELRREMTLFPGSSDFRGSTRSGLYSAEKIARLFGSSLSIGREDETGKIVCSTALYLPPAEPLGAAGTAEIAQLQQNPQALARRLRCEPDSVHRESKLSVA